MKKFAKPIFFLLTLTMPNMLSAADRVKHDQNVGHILVMIKDVNLISAPGGTHVETSSIVKTIYQIPPSEKPPTTGSIIKMNIPCDGAAIIPLPPCSLYQQGTTLDVWGHRSSGDIYVAFDWTVIDD